MASSPPTGAMTEAQALEVLGELLRTIAGVDPSRLQPSCRFVEDLGVDSLGMMEMILEAETRFCIAIDAGELPRLLTVADLLQLLRQHGAID